MGYERSGRYYRDSGDQRDGWRDREERHQQDMRDRDYRARGYAQPPGFDDDRGFFERAGDEVRSWFGDEEAERRRRWDERMHQREDERRYGGRDRHEDGGRFADAAGYRGGHTGSFGYGRSRDFGTGYHRGNPEWGAGRGAGATMNYGLGAAGDHDGWGESGYGSWRRRQIESLDRDYDEYRHENEQRFQRDFGSWRDTRQNQRAWLGHVQEKQEVVGSDGVHIGTVDHVRGDRILLTRSDKDAGGRHHSIPVSWISEVADKVKVNRTADQAHAAWKDEERSEGPHYLNRAFPGTY